VRRSSGDHGAAWAGRMIDIIVTLHSVDFFR
jgi:hypothetical protein